MKHPGLAFYILDGRGKPVPEPDLGRWEEWFRCSQNRVLKQDVLSGGVRVSTVFLGFDYNLSGNGPPLLWETMIFGGGDDRACQRYGSRKDALAGHVRAVEMAKGKSAHARQ
jgi:hypothetical protein